MPLKLNVSAVIAGLFYIGLFFIPFNTYEGLGFLGEFKKEAAAVFFLIAFCFLLLKKKVFIPIKNPIFQIFLLFLIWTIISVILNIFEVSTNNLKDTNGLVRFIRAFVSVIISGIVFFLVYFNVFAKNSKEFIFYKVRKILFYSFVFVVIVAFFEILIIKLNIVALKPLYHLFNYLPFTVADLDTNLHRVSSVTYEPPALATYLCFLFGWMASYIITEKGLKKYIPIAVVFILSFLTGSRSALVFIFLQAILFMFLLLTKTKYNKFFIRIVKYSSIIIFVLLLFKGKTLTEYIFEKATSFSVEEGDHRVSNKTRLGIQYASLQVFLESPIYGVGYGQLPYRARDLYPEWATKNNWEFRLRYLNDDYNKFPPSYNLYLRLLAETGLIGFLIFFIFIVSVIYVAFIFYKNSTKEEAVFYLVIITTLFGLSINWLKEDTFRTFGFWVTLALFYRLTQDKYIKVYE